MSVSVTPTYVYFNPTFDWALDPRPPFLDIFMCLSHRHLQSNQSWNGLRPSSFSNVLTLLQSMYWLCEFLHTLTCEFCLIHVPPLHLHFTALVQSPPSPASSWLKASLFSFPNSILFFHFVATILFLKFFFFFSKCKSSSQSWVVIPQGKMCGDILDCYNDWPGHSWT